MSRFYPVTIEEVRDLLKKENGWNEETGAKDKEAVFQYHLRNYPNVLVKVYTGIKKDSGQSRKVGKDAIRVCAVRIEKGEFKGFIKAKRVHRVQGWRENLKNRAIQVIQQAKTRAGQSEFTFSK
jgi:hypothetical protein